MVFVIFLSLQSDAVILSTS